MRTKFNPAKKTYVPQPMLANMGPVTITTKKLNSQLLACLGSAGRTAIVTYSGETIGGSPDAEWGDFGGVKPCHPQPTDGEP